MMDRSVARALLVPLATLVPIACAEEDAGAPARGGPAAWEVESTPVVAVGRTEGEEAYLFQRVAAARLLADDRFLVVDDGMRVLRIFRMDGTFVRELGRPGEGPGEFASVSTAWVRGDTVAAYDYRTQRVNRFLLDGTHLETVRILPEEGRPDVAIGAFSDGSPVVSWLTTALGPDTRGRIVPDTMHWGVFEPDGDFVGWIGTDLGMNRYMDETGGGPTPFSPFGHPVLWRDTLFYTSGRRPEVSVRTRSGEVVRTIALPPNPLDADAAWAALEDTIGAGEQEFLVERLQNIPRTDSLPHVAEMLMDDRGRIWVKPFVPMADASWLGGWAGGEGGEWWVVERDGTHAATLRLPDGFTPLDVRGDLILGKARNEMDVERVVVFRIGGRG